MAQNTLPVVGSAAVANVQTDTAATANTVVMRGPNGETTSNTVTGSSLVTTGSLVIQGIGKTGTFTADTTTTVIPCDATAAAFTVTLPSAAVTGGRVYEIVKVDSGANAITVGVTGGDHINGATSFALAAQWNAVRVWSNGVGVWVVLSSR